MTEFQLDPDRLAAIHEALAQWRMFARSARTAGRADQRRLSLDLLQAARQLAAGVDSLSQLEQQHQRHGVVVGNLQGAAAGAATRLGHRTASVRQLEEAAARLASEPEPSERQRSAAAIHGRITAELDGLDDARRRVRKIEAELARLTEHHARAGRELAQLRVELNGLRAQAERGLALMTSAGRRLDEADELYETAQVSASDLRRELLPGPVGPRYEAPVSVEATPVRAPDPLVAVSA